MGVGGHTGVEKPCDTPREEAYDRQGVGARDPGNGTMICWRTALGQVTALNFSFFPEALSWLGQINRKALCSCNCASYPAKPKRTRNPPESFLKESLSFKRVLHGTFSRVLVAG